ncbi:hypothetical protein FNF27_06568 [Cafeteria roenbergensis]|nr:hypothetical protein FNF31_01719 [Cafeteria roenbergensis]KAA0170506.1 hypothetical protein FNF27_06568 [Cafeteria roenbergensis]
MAVAGIVRRSANRSGALPAAPGSIRLMHASAPSAGMEEFFAPAYGVDGEGKRMRKPVGRSWRAAELRGKSFEDLHRLWWVCLKEKNALMTDRMYYNQVSVEMPDSSRVRKVRKTMARIKRVLSERKMAVDRAIAAADSVDLGEPLPAFEGEMVTLKKFGRKYEVPSDHPMAQRPTRAEHKEWARRRGRRDRFLARQAAIEAARAKGLDDLPEDVRKWYAEREAGQLQAQTVDDAIGRAEADTRFAHQEEGLGALRAAAAAEVEEAARERARAAKDAGSSDDDDRA